MKGRRAVICIRLEVVERHPAISTHLTKVRRFTAARKSRNHDDLAHFYSRRKRTPNDPSTQTNKRRQRGLRTRSRERSYPKGTPRERALHPRISLRFYVPANSAPQCLPRKVRLRS